LKPISGKAKRLPTALGKATIPCFLSINKEIPSSTFGEIYMDKEPAFYVKVGIDFFCKSIS
jgi:hypothetical protein